MREISPVANLSADEYFVTVSPVAQTFIETIRKRKLIGTRPLPSTTLIDQSKLLTADTRKTILDKISRLVDENIYGRSEMCEQFASLLKFSLNYVGLQARIILGTSIYYSADREIFRWQHAWVESGREVIDGNVDILYENPFVPSSVNVAPYWGTINAIPKDRRLIPDKTRKPSKSDIDVSNIWRPELKIWLDEVIIPNRS